MTAEPAAPTTTRTPPETPPAPNGQGPATAPPPGIDKRLTALRRFAISITALNVVGHLFLGFEQSPVTPIAAVLTAYTVELLLERLDSAAKRRPARYAGGAKALLHFLLPAHIAGLACAMLLYGNASLWPVMFAVTAGISTKYVLKARMGGRWRHVMNPSNAGISLTLVLFPWVGISPPYHFTANVGTFVDWLLPLGVLMAGTMLNAKLTNRMPLILAWLGGFVAQAAVRTLVLDHLLVASLLPATGVAFILFTNYMIPDPGTTPFTARGQVWFGLSTAAVYGVLVSVHVVFGLFFALTITCAVRALVLNLRDGLRSLGRLRSAPAEPWEVATQPRNAPAG